MKKEVVRILLSVAALTLLSCDTSGSSTTTSTTTTSTAETGPWLYVSSGSCHSGTGNTTFTAATASNLVYRLNVASGTRQVIADYWDSLSQSGDSPASIINMDSNNLYVLVENATAGNRRIETVAKSVNGARTLKYSNAGAFTTVMRSMYLDSGGNLVFSKSASIELITPAPARPYNPYLNPTGAPCSPAVTLISKVLPLSNGKVVFLHSNTAQNKVGVFAATGGGTACQTSTAPPNAGSFPTAAFYDSANLKLIVAYSGNATTTDLNSIYAYTVNETTGVLSASQKIYDAANYPGTQNFLLYGISDMHYDSTTGMVYIATAISTATTVVNYAIEKLTYTPSLIGVTNTSVLTRVGTTPWYNYGNDTKCISSMFIGD